MKQVVNTLIRLAVENEKAALEALQLRASLANDGDREALLENPDAINLPLEHIKNGQTLVAERGDTIVGFAVTLPRDDGDCELDGLFVEPDIWRGGIGRALVDACCTHAKRVGASYLHVVGNPHAEGFYVACGFEQYGLHETRFGTGLLMRKAI